MPGAQLSQTSNQLQAFQTGMSLMPDSTHMVVNSDAEVPASMIVLGHFDICPGRVLDAHDGWL